MKIFFSFITVVLVLTFFAILSPTYAQWLEHRISTKSNPVPYFKVADIDGDDALDMVAAYNVTDEILWYKNTNAGLSWEEYTIDDTLYGAHMVWLGDINSDDMLDVVASGQNAGDVVWYENDGGTPINWTKYFIDADLIDARSVAVADIDGDDTLDVIATSWNLGDVVWYENNHPNWTKYTIEENLDGANYIYPADLDGDDDPDVIVTGFRADRIVWYENNHPNWSRFDIDPNINGPVIVDVADIDGDGDPDVVASGEYDHDVVWYENDQLTWYKHVVDGSLGNVLGVAIGDMNGDDAPDVVAAGLSAHKVIWYENNLPSDSWIANTIGSLNYTEIVKVADINSDTYPDVVLATFGYYAGTDDGDLYWYANPAEKIYAKSLQTFPRFISTQGDTLFLNAQIHNPETHPATAYVIINGQQYAFKDSLQLYDDGLHSDGVAADNIWGNSKWLSGLQEDIYTIDVTTHDMTEDFIHSVPLAANFTTIGSIFIDSVEITSTDTMANPGDRIRVRLHLKNEGLNGTAMNITTPKELTSLDSNATIEATGVTLPSFGDIAPGEISDGNKGYNIDFSLGGQVDKEYKFVVDILSGDYHFWSDTFYVYVYPTGIEENSETIPIEFALQQNYPNPFNPNTVISWQLAIGSQVELAIYNILGEKMRTLVSEKQKTGYHKIEFNAQNLPSGVYFYRLEAGKFQDVKKMILLR